MKYLLIIFVVLTALNCKPAAPKTENATAAATSAIVAPKDSIVEKKSTIPWDAKGKLLEKFEQNNALFERFSDEAKELEWLRITTKNGKCTILDDVGRANHSSVSFEDWDKDGFKDRVNNWKWDYEVCLFDKTKNDFSRLINGRFNGDQWDLIKIRIWNTSF